MLLKDARQAVKRLQEGGVPEEQANAIVDLFVDADEQIATQQGLSDLETKIDGVEQRLTARIDKVDTKVDEVEQRLTAKIDSVDTKVDEVEQHLTAKIDEVEQRLTAKIDSVDTKVDQVEQRLQKQMEVQEERLTRKIQDSETRLLRWVMGAFAALAALLTIFEFVL